MASGADLVISGIGLVTPIGIGCEAFRASLAAGRSGVRRLDLLSNDPGLPAPIGGEVADFDPKVYVKPRKSLKVMSRDIQFGFAAADMAMTEAGLHAQRVDPERLGVVFGADMISCELDEMSAPYRKCMVGEQFEFARWGEAAMPELFPLWMLKYLPNMPACHVGIAEDARGPNNTLTLGEVSSLSGFLEAVRVVERGQADVMITGGAACRLHPMLFFRAGLVDMAPDGRDPTTVMRPFEAHRSGIVRGEGAAAFTIERRAQAEARGAKPLARILGGAAAFEPQRNGGPFTGSGIRQAIRRALADAGVQPCDVGHVNAHGASAVVEDAVEAQAIHAELGDVPVFAPRSYFGSLGAAAGAVELAASVLALQSGEVPPTLNYEQPDPACPVQVVHGAPQKLSKPVALALNYETLGQAVALVIAAAE